MGFVVMPEQVHAIVWFRVAGQLSLFLQQWTRLTSYQIRRLVRSRLVRYASKIKTDQPSWRPKYYSFNLSSSKFAPSDPGWPGSSASEPPEIRSSGGSLRSTPGTLAQNLELLKLARCASGWPGSTGTDAEALVGEPPVLQVLWAHFVRPQPPEIAQVVSKAVLTGPVPPCV